MKKDVKAAIADIFKQENVEYVFGYTGGHIMQMWEAVNNTGIKMILNKQEGNGVYMADAFARITQKPSIVLGTAGPGATNMITGLATALLDSVPLIAIGANVETSAFGRNAVQDGSGRGRSTEQRLAFKAICKQAMLAPSPDVVPHMTREAFRIASSGRPGPVYLEIPSDFWDKEINYVSLKPYQYKNTVIPECGRNKSQEIVKKMLLSKQPMILIGEGALEPDIQTRMMAFIEKLGIPFGVSPIGKNVVDEFSSLYLGVARLEGKTQKIYEYMRASDFILLLGDRLQEWETAWYDESLVKNATLVQVDSDSDEIGRVFPVDMSVVGSISSFIGNSEPKRHANAKDLQGLVKELWGKYPRYDRLEDGDGMNPLNINNIVEELAMGSTPIVCDTGYAKSMAIMKYRTKLNQPFLVADKNGPMGYSVPAALGASLATGKKVVCFVGDGGFQMTLNELGTLMNYDLEVVYIIENNSGCISIVDFHTETYGHHCADTFENPDYVKIAEAYKMSGYQVETTTDFEEAFKEAFEQKGSAIIDVKVDQSRMVWE